MATGETDVALGGLELAMRRNLPLATLDKELLAAVKLAGVERA